MGSKSRDLLEITRKQQQQQFVIDTIRIIKELRVAEDDDRSLTGIVVRSGSSGR